MIVLGGKASDVKEARAMAEEVIANGKALDKLAAFVKAQGGDPEQVYHPEKLHVSEKSIAVKAGADGFVERIICDEVGVSCMMLGGGRASKEDTIDLSVGIKLLKKRGDEVRCGEELAIVYYSDEKSLPAALDKLSGAYIISYNKPEKEALIKKVID
jgi:pyrimidine-nucleoside phosphorylase